MASIMFTLIPTVKIFDSVCPPYHTWSKGLGISAMINEFYNHYTGDAVEPDEPVRPVKPKEPQATTSIKEWQKSLISPTPDQKQQCGDNVKRYAKDMEKWEKDVIQYDKEYCCWKKNKNKAMGLLCATTTIAV
ncbi:hypothetical protein PQX77_019754 [Marasmius sp. AFHP31]|nr:hypothetical protein PQX77_019754 [Marasmius sp. AFHP31]